MSDWQFYIARSSDMELMFDITGQCREKQFQLSLNRPGTFSFTLPMFADYVNELKTVKHCVIARKNKSTVWSGPLWTKSEDFAGEKMACSAVGWFQLLNKRFITDADKTYSAGTNRGDVAFALLNYANTQEIDGVVRPTWITAGSNSSTVNITGSITYNRWQNIGQEIINLSDVESGFDFEVDPVTREMNLKEWSDYRDNTNAVFGFNFGPNNVNNATREESGEDMANQEFVAGQYGIAEAHDSDSTHFDEYGLHQNVININEINNTSILGAIANAELAVNMLPKLVINFEPKGEFLENVPSLFEDYVVGDKVYLTAKRDNAEIDNQAIRLFGLTMNIDENDNEKVSSLQTTAQLGS